MRCILCENLSFSLICKKCQNSFLKPNLSKRELLDDFWVYSFYRYSEIENLLTSKHTFVGYFIYKILAKNSFLPFAKNFKIDFQTFVIPIDDVPYSGYSHTAILARFLKGKNLFLKYHSLIALNRVKYWGKSLDFRLKNPRNFKYTFKKGIDVILVDDIVTTGSTLKEAKKTLEKYDVNVLFALTLADARNPLAQFG